MSKKIMSGRMGEDTEAIRRNWPFPYPPLKKPNKELEVEFDAKLKVYDEIKNLERQFERA